jgi:dTDP-4-amino-4,6-dideoxygalactose transaminase
MGGFVVINIAKPLIGNEEKQAVLEVLDSGIIAQGPRVKAFEDAFAEMCGVRHAIATSSGTTALHTALLAHGIGDNDEVITSPFTFIASANSILYTGARPVFVDIDNRTFNLDPGRIKEVISERTRAIMPVHLFGLSCDMDPIIQIAEEYGLVIVEDACQSHGATYHGQKVGSFGSGVFSLYPTKNITSAEGGMITTDDDATAEQCRMIRQHGMRTRYLHEQLGFNFRMSDIHAAIGLEQLRKLERFNNSRQENAAYLSANLRGVVTPQVPEGYQHVFHQYTIRVPDGHRDALRNYLRERGVGSEVYYPAPVHKQPIYESDPRYHQTYPESELAAKEVLSIPVHPGLNTSDLGVIVGTVNEFMANPIPITEVDNT